MKKIGILSMHRVINYGSFLQAYALKKLIEEVYNNEDCEIEFIDIKKGRNLYKNSTANKIARCFIYLFQGRIFEKIRKRKFDRILREQFVDDFYPLLEPISAPDSKLYDLVVIGSDEVFHCCQNTEWGFSTQLYGDIPNAKKIISYAASFGATTLNELQRFNLQKEICDSLKKLSAISVRDDNSRDIIERLTGMRSELHLDPVLVYGYKKEMGELPDFSCDEKFMVVYSYNGRITNKKEIAAIKSFAKENELKIYTIFCQYKWADKVIIPSMPFEVFKIFQKAEFIVSDTFHGTIFSIITHKKFCTLIRESNRAKLVSLLEPLGLENHIVENTRSLNSISIIMKNIDYAKVEICLDAERERARVYLRENI